MPRSLSRRDIVRRAAATVGLLAVAAAQQQTVDEDELSKIRDWLGETAARLTEDNPGEFLDAFAKPLRLEIEPNVRAMVLAAQVSSSIQIHTVTVQDTARIVDCSWYLALHFRAAATGTERRQKGVRMRLEPAGKSSWRIVEFTPLDLFEPPVLR